MNQPQKYSYVSSTLTPQDLKVVPPSSFARAQSETVRQRVRLCLILKLLSSTLDPVERVYLRMAIRQCVSQFRSNSGGTRPPGFDNSVELQIRQQVGEARWQHCEALAEKLLANKNRNVNHSSLVRPLPQQQGPYW